MEVSHRKTIIQFDLCPGIAGDYIYITKTAGRAINLHLHYNVAAVYAVTYFSSFLYSLIINIKKCRI